MADQSSGRSRKFWKDGKVLGPNPAADVDKRKVPRRAPAFLEAGEVPRLLAQPAVRSESAPRDHRRAIQRSSETALHAGNAGLSARPRSLPRVRGGDDPNPALQLARERDDRAAAK